jgi:hypothetical protein
MSLTLGKGRGGERLAYSRGQAARHSPAPSVRPPKYRVQPETAAASTPPLRKPADISVNTNFDNAALY